MKAIAKRRSRMSRQSSGRRVEITARDLEIFRLLARYRYLRSHFIHGFIGGDRTRLLDRLGRLYHDGRYIGRPPQQWQLPNCRHTPVIYELDKRGAEALTEHGEDTTWARPAGQGQLLHSLMACEIVAAIELAARDHALLRFVPLQEILSHPRMSPAARARARRDTVPIHGLNNAAVVPDAVFGLEYRVGAEKTYRFFALEADRDTMPLTRRKSAGSNHIEKLRRYRTIIEQGIHRTQLGLPNLFVLTVTSTQPHLERMTEAAGRAIGPSRYFLFMAMPHLGTDGEGLKMNRLLYAPWVRVGAEALCLQKT